MKNPQFAFVPKGVQLKSILQLNKSRSKRICESNSFAQNHNR
jgi:hypothetical protein